MAPHRYRSIRVAALCIGVFTVAVALWGYLGSNARASGKPKIDRERSVLRKVKGENRKELVIVGENFDPASIVEVRTGMKGDALSATAGLRILDSKTIIMDVGAGPSLELVKDGVATIKITNPGGETVTETLAVIPSAIGPSPLSRQDIEQIIAQGVSACVKLGVKGTFAVLDREGNILALYQMKGAFKTVVVRDVGKEGAGLEGVGGSVAPGAIPATAAVISKAGVGAFFGTFGNAFSTRTAAYIIREHIPPGIKNMPGGPLFGVQVSSLGCSDVKQPGLPLGLAGDPGGFPIYKNGIPSGGFSVEINGIYGVARNNPKDLSQEPVKLDPNVNELFAKEDVEEAVALAGLRGFEAPDAITGDKILVNGIRLPYKRNIEPIQFDTIAFRSLPGRLLTIPETGNAEIRTGVPSEFRDIILRDKAVRVVNRFFPTRNDPDRGGLTAADAEQMLFQGVTEAYRVRAAIRRPIEVFAEVNLTAVGRKGAILGIVSTPDAPVFGFDVSSEKARSALFFSSPEGDALLRRAGLNFYADRFIAEGIRLGDFAFTARSVGWLSRPFYPDGIEDRQDQGAPVLASEPADFSPLNNGFQTDYLLKGGRSIADSVIVRSVSNVLTGKRGTAPFCDATNGAAGSMLNSTLMIFTGGGPAFKGGQLAGAFGISGDGIDQDNIIQAYGLLGFDPDPEKRVDRFFYRGIRIPYNKFPRHPHLGEEDDD